MGEHQGSMNEELSEGRESTRHRLLDAGVDLWVSETPADLFGGLSVARVARSAGVTRTTFYAYWSSTEEYLLDLTQHLSDPDRGTDPVRPGAGADALRPGGMSLVERFLEACDVYIERLASDRRLRLRLGLTSKVDDPELAAALRDVLHQTELVRSQVFAGTLPAWGRVARSPIENHHLQAAFSALAEGLAVRHILDPERFPVRTYGLCALSLLFVVSTRTGDTRDLYSVLEAANDWTSSAAADRRKTSSEIGAPLPTDTIRELVIQARRLSAVEGWADLSLTGLASATSTSEAQVRQSFGSKYGLGMAIFFLNVFERYEDLDTSLDPIATLRAMIAINLDELGRSPSLAQAIAMIISGGATFARRTTFSFDPHPPLVAAVARAQAAGQLDSKYESERLALTIGRSMLFASLPSANSPGLGHDDVELVLLGAGAPPRPRDTT